MSNVERVTNILKGFPMIQIHSAVDAGEQLTVLFRTLDPQAWAQVVAEMLRVEDVLGPDAPFSLHICRQYVRHEGKLRYVPHMTITGPEGLDKALEALATLLEELKLEGLPAAAPLPKAPTKAMPKAQHISQAKKEPEKQEGSPTVQTVPLIGQKSGRNQPRGGLWQSGSKGAHLIRSTQ